MTCSVTIQMGLYGKTGRSGVWVYLDSWVLWPSISPNGISHHLLPC